MLSGTYNAEDVTFLLKEIFLESTSIEDKEKNIQKNTSHYSEMITHEKAPTAHYMDIFYSTLELNRVKFATHLMVLAQKINIEYKNKDEVVIVSLARAGTPIGVILTQILRHNFSRKVTHYTASIIRDKGLDLNALKFITDKHSSSSIAFIDGWTGKGVIGQELKQSVDVYNIANNTRVSPNLYVVADISGTAYWSASSEDYLIPSAVLNSTISGLVSRTILIDKYIGKDDYHGCLFYNNLLEHDISQWFADEIFNEAQLLSFETIKNCFDEAEKTTKQNFQKQSKATIEKFLSDYKLDNRNYIKPGIGESTRVLLRRLPKELVIKNRNDVNIQHLLHLCEQKQVPVRLDSDLCYNCVAVIEVID
jgi:Phosphoribosyl transferase (PRTase)/PELOTA RNA binding domain